MVQRDMVSLPRHPWLMHCSDNCCCCCCCCFSYGCCNCYSSCGSVCCFCCSCILFSLSHAAQNWHNQPCSAKLSHAYTSSPAAAGVCSDVHCMWSVLLCIHGIFRCPQCAACCPLSFVHLASLGSSIAVAAAYDCDSAHLVCSNSQA